MRVGEHPERRGRHREDGVRETCRGPDLRVAPELGIHDHAGTLGVAEGRDAADREAGQLVRFARGGTPDVPATDDGRESLQVDTVRPGDEAQDRLELAIVAGRHEDERLHDLGEVRADGPGRLAGSVGRLGEDRHVEGHALAGGRVKHPEDGGVLQDGGHGREDSIGRRRRIGPVDAIVFDWDGTLVDSLPAIFDANHRVLTELGLPFDDARYRAAYVPDWRLMYQRLGVPDDALETAGERWLTLYRETDAAGLLPRVDQALRRLSAAGFVLGLVTAGHRDVVGAQLERFGIGDLLPIRVFGSDPIASKPHPEPLLRALTELGRAERIATARYVGDVPDDMRMARAVGALGIGIESSIGTRDELFAAGAAEVHPTVADFVDALVPEESASDAECLPQP